MNLYLLFISYCRQYGKKYTRYFLNYMYIAVVICNKQILEDTNC